jgi:hypothetical protein
MNTTENLPSQHDERQSPVKADAVAANEVSFAGDQTIEMSPEAEKQLQAPDEHGAEVNVASASDDKVAVASQDEALVDHKPAEAEQTEADNKQEECPPVMPEADRTEEGDNKQALASATSMSKAEVEADFEQPVCSAAAEKPEAGDAEAIPEQCSAAKSNEAQVSASLPGSQMLSRKRKLSEICDSKQESKVSVKMMRLNDGTKVAVTQSASLQKQSASPSPADDEAKSAEKTIEGEKTDLAEQASKQASKEVQVATQESKGLKCDIV